MINSDIEKQTVREVSAVFKALGSPVRLQMLLKLAESECCVCELVELVGLGFPAVSRHLSVMKAVGLVSDEKRGQQVFYRLALPCVISFCDCLSRGSAGIGANVCSARGDSFNTSHPLNS